MLLSHHSNPDFFFSDGFIGNTAQWEIKAGSSNSRPSIRARLVLICCAGTFKASSDRYVLSARVLRDTCRWFREFIESMLIKANL